MFMGPVLKGRVVDNFILKALNQQPLQINGSGNQTRSFLYIDDCIDAFYRIFRKNIKKEIFNIGQNKEEKIKDLAKLIMKITGTKSKLILKSNQLKKFKGFQDIERRVPDNNKLKKAINWKPVLFFGIWLEKHDFSFN